MRVLLIGALLRVSVDITSTVNRCRSPRRRRNAGSPRRPWPKRKSSPVIRCRNCMPRVSRCIKAAGVSAATCAVNGITMTCWTPS